MEKKKSVDFFVSVNVRYDSCLKIIVAFMVKIMSVVVINEDL